MDKPLVAFLLFILPTLAWAQNQNIWDINFSKEPNSYYVIKGTNADSFLSKSTLSTIISELNNVSVQQSRPKIKLVNTNKDTLKIRILNEDLLKGLSEYEGFAFLASVVYTLTDTKKYSAINFEFVRTQYLSPGLYTRRTIELSIL